MRSSTPSSHLTHYSFLCYFHVSFVGCELLKERGSVLIFISLLTNTVADVKLIFTKHSMAKWLKEWILSESDFYDSSVSKYMNYKVLNKFLKFFKSQCYLQKREDNYTNLSNVIEIKWIDAYKVSPQFLACGKSSIYVSYYLKILIFFLNHVLQSLAKYLQPISKLIYVQTQFFVLPGLIICGGIKVARSYGWIFLYDAWVVVPVFLNVKDTC